MNRHDLLSNIDNPRQLEKLYRTNKNAFKAEFNLLYPELTDNKLAVYWNERLNFEGSDLSWGSRKGITFVVIASMVAALIAKLPAIFNIAMEFFYPRNLGLIVFPVLSAYFLWKNNLPVSRSIFPFAVFVIAAVFINFLPVNEMSDTLILSCIHLPVFLWAILGYTFTGNDYNQNTKRLEFLKYNGDLAIMCALLLIAGGIITGVTIGLFNVIGLRIEQFYFENVVIAGLAAVPMVATYLTQTNPQLVNRISPLIAKIFSPVVLVTLTIYLVAIFNTGRSPYQDRDYLILFNLLLIGVMAMILFSVVETSGKSEVQSSTMILFALSVVTIIINGIALSAILFRISEWGMTPNRLAVLGSNVLMLTNLFMVNIHLLKSLSKKLPLTNVGNSICMFLPVYALWAFVVAFVFPFIFDYR